MTLNVNSRVGAKDQGPTINIFFLNNKCSNSDIAAQELKWDVKLWASR